MTLALTWSAVTAVVVSMLLLAAPTPLSPWWAGLPLLFFRWVPCHARMLLVIVMLVGVRTLLVALQWEHTVLADDCERVPLTIEGRVQGLVQTMDGFHGPVFRARVAIEELLPERCSGPSNVWLYMALPTAPRAGDRLIGEVLLRRPWGTMNPQAPSRERGFLVDGIDATGSLRRGGELVPRARPGFGDRLTRRREALSRALRKGVGEGPGALLAALTVGDQRFMTPTSWERLRTFGLTHLLVISGLHISLLAALGWAVGSSLRRSLSVLFSQRCFSLLPPLLAVLLASLYAALSGFALPAQRALIMLTLAVTLRLVARRWGMGQLIAAVVLILLFIDPLSVLDTSFWLSLGAVIVLLFATQWHSGNSKLQIFLRSQLFMVVAMLPPGIFWFGSGSVLGALVNLVAIPWMTFLVVPLAVAGALLFALTPTMAMMLWQAAAAVLMPLWYALGFWEPALASTRFSGVATVPTVLPGVVAVMVLAPPAFPGQRISAILLLLPLVIWRIPTQHQVASVLVMDVGQGTAVLVTQGGERLLYDTGGGAPGRPPVAAHSIDPYLRARGTEFLDYLVVSHDDQDHSGGADYLRQRYVIGRERYPGNPGAVSEGDCRAGRRERLGSDMLIQHLAFRRADDSDNNSSCVVKISVFGRHFLLPGDIDRQREREMVAYWGDRLQADVLLAAHHGSGSSSSRLFIRTVDPHWVVISAARANRFGHPAASVVDATQQRRSLLLNTAERGAISFTVRPDGSISCRGTRHRGLPFWQRSPRHVNCDGR